MTAEEKAKVGPGFVFLFWDFCLFFFFPHGVAKWWGVCLVCFP